MRLLEPEEVISRLTSLAAWLELQSDDKPLLDSHGSIIVAEPHLCSQMLRILLPAPSRA